EPLDSRAGYRVGSDLRWSGELHQSGYDDQSGQWSHGQPPTLSILLFPTHALSISRPPNPSNSKYSSGVSSLDRAQFPLSLRRACSRDLLATKRQVTSASPSWRSTSPDSVMPARWI